MPFDPLPTTLTGHGVSLEPLDVRHCEGLFAAGRDEDIWRHLPTDPPADVADMRRWIDAAHTEPESLPFAIVVDGVAAGSTRYLDIDRAHRSLEIGWTWIGPAWRRTAVNTACKLLLLTHAFEDLGSIRVFFKTDLRNERSQRALERIGAVREGVWRKHRILPDGVVRDSVFYSIIDDEWPTVAGRLRDLLARS